MANHHFTNTGPTVRLRVDEGAPLTGGNGRTGKLYLQGLPTLTQGKRQIQACQAAGLTDVVR
jgi:hypothetical protein